MPVEHQDRKGPPGRPCCCEPGLTDECDGAPRPEPEAAERKHLPVLAGALEPPFGRSLERLRQEAQPGARRETGRTQRREHIARPALAFGHGRCPRTTA